MLAAYQSQLQALIQAPNSPTPLVPSVTQIQYINTARAQLAGDAECIRTTGLLSLTVGVEVYDFSTIVLPGSHGYGRVLTVRSALLNGNNLDVRSWEWYQAYYLGRTATGTPVVMGQQGQGTLGTLWFSPIPAPASAPVVQLDCVCLPIALADDTTVEAIPDLWRDAVPFYAAWLAMQSLQRQADAQAMLGRYMLLSRRGRQTATSSELPDNMPGGAGTQMAAVRTTLGQPPSPQGG